MEDKNLLGKVKAVVHIYQPAFGVPAAYWRLCTGWGEGKFSSGWALGYNQDACTETHAGWASVTELLPNNTYCNLLQKELNGAEADIFTQEYIINQGEEKFDIYEMYKKDNYEGQIGKQNKPEKLGLSVIASSGGGGTVKKFKENIAKAKEFHEEKLKDYFFKETYVIDSLGVNTTVFINSFNAKKDAENTLGKLVADGKAIQKSKKQKSHVQKKKLNGKIYKWLLRVNQKNGDGTVSGYTHELVKSFIKIKNAKERFHKVQNKNYEHDKLGEAAEEIIKHIKNKWKLFEFRNEK